MRRAVSDADKSRRRDELLAAARQVFAANGYHGTTMADVARAAGLSYGVAYWYFDSKDDLFKAAMTAEEEALRSSIADALGAVSGDGLRPMLQAGVAAAFRHFDDDPVAGILLFREPVSVGQAFEQHLFSIFGRFIEEIDRAVDAGRRRGSVKPAPHDLTAFAIASLISAMTMRRSRTDDGMTADEAAAFLVSVVFDGVGLAD